MEVDQQADRLVVFLRLAFLDVRRNPIPSRFSARLQLVQIPSAVCLDFCSLPLCFRRSFRFQKPSSLFSPGMSGCPEVSGCPPLDPTAFAGVARFILLPKAPQKIVSPAIAGLRCRGYEQITLLLFGQASNPDI